MLGWNSRMFSLEVRIIFFKTLAISKIFHLTFSKLIDRMTSKNPKNVYMALLMSKK